MAGFLSVLPVVGATVDKLLNLIPDPNARARAEAEYNNAVLNAVVQAGADQRAINQAEAQHQSLFVAGWRPAFGWGCAAALLYGYIVSPWLTWLLAVYAPEHLGKLPAFPLEHVWELIFGLLGMGGLRTYEKTKAVAK